VVGGRERIDGRAMRFAAGHGFSVVGEQWFCHGAMRVDHGSFQFSHGSELLDRGHELFAFGGLHFDFGAEQFDFGAAHADRGAMRFDRGAARFDLGAVRCDCGAVHSDFDAVHFDFGAMLVDHGSARFDVAALHVARGGVRIVLRCWSSDHRHARIAGCILLFADGEAECGRTSVAFAVLAAQFDLDAARITGHHSSLAIVA
jgi:hypothetical protein